jgi:prepilin-type N-terminal cleavage/methylation domain-containing protein
MLRKRSVRSQGGFTFIEVLIALVVVTVLALLGLPAILQMMARFELEQSGRQITAVLQQARLAAIREGAPAVVIVEGRGLRSFVDLSEPPNSALDSGVDRELGEMQLHRRVDFKLSGTPYVAVFQPNGSVDTAGEPAYVLKNHIDDEIEIVVSPRATGRVDLVKKY